MSVLLDIKRHLDHGFHGNQIATKLGISANVVSRLIKGDFGKFQKSDIDLELKSELRQINLKKMRVKLSKRKVTKKS